jgi:hypothetical protein
MKHEIHSVQRVRLTGDYSLELQFSDGFVRDIDFSAMLEGEIYGALRNPELFAQVRIDPEVQTIVWPGGADFDPTILHDWPEHEPAFVNAARRWKEKRAEVFR